MMRTSCAYRAPSASFAASAVKTQPEDSLVLFGGGHAILFSFPIQRFLFRKHCSTTEMLPAQEAWRISGEGLFTGVRGETVWKFGIGPEWGFESGQEEPKEFPFGRILSPQRRAERP